jgi:acyl-CoA thioesterase II
MTSQRTRPLIHQADGHGAFGGSLISQAISAAAATVPPDFDVYTSQSSFLRPTHSEKQVRYRVDCVAQGRNVATRVVHATRAADGPSLYVAVLSFQKRGRRPTSRTAYADAMPSVGSVDPQDLPKQSLTQLGLRPAWPLNGSSTKTNDDDDDDDEEDSFDWRPLPFKPTPDPSQIRVHGFVRSRPLSVDDAAVHLSSLAFLSDQNLLELLLFANWDEAPENLRDLAFSTTLTHHLSFHNLSARSDEWMMCEGSTSWGAHGRVFIHQRFWSLETGQLLMSCTQEALVGLGQARL